MKYFIAAYMLLCGYMASAQSGMDYMIQMAADAGIKRPVPQKFSMRAVRVPIPMDSLSLAGFHHKYITTMTAGTMLLGGGALVVVTHILIAAFVPHFNENLVIAIATTGMSAVTAGSIALPIGASERHRYKKSLRIALAKGGF